MNDYYNEGYILKIDPKIFDRKFSTIKNYIENQSIKIFEIGFFKINNNGKEERISFNYDVSFLEAKNKLDCIIKNDKIVYEGFIIEQIGIYFNKPIKKEKFKELVTGKNFD